MRSYSEEFKKEAIRLSDEIGSKKAAAQLGIPYYTLADWRNHSKHKPKVSEPEIGGQPNPFENDTPTEIDDRPVEDYIGEGEDRRGEGIHF